MTNSSPVLISAVVGAIALSVFYQTETSAQAKVNSSRPLQNISSMQAKASNSTKQDDAIVGCLIEPKASSQVAASAPGVITEIRVDRGDTVTKGQVLAILDNNVERALLAAARTRSETQAAVTAARASRDMALKKLTRTRKLEALSYGAKLELELAKGELDVAQSRLQLAKDQLRAARGDHRVASSQLARREVLSPIDGVVADRMLNPGERADGRAIVRVIQLDALRVEVILPAVKFGKISTGMSGNVFPDVADAASVSGTVDQVDQFIDAASGTFRARMSIQNSDLAVPAGVRCRVEFSQHDSISAPNRS